MIARILLKRRGGVAITGKRAPGEWSVEGYIETATDREKGGRRLTHRALMSAPGCHVLNELYIPEFVGMEDGCFLVRGAEMMESDAGPAAVVQEWLIKPRGA